MLNKICRMLCTLSIALAAAKAQALFALPPVCEFDPFDPICVPNGEPNLAATGELVGSALFAKLQLVNPQYSPEDEVQFVAEWTAAWMTFPVPLAIEQEIAALDPNNFNAWLEWLCAGLYPGQQPAIIDFEQAPQLVIDSFSAANSAAVPLPASAWLFASAILGLVAGRKRRH